MSVTEPRPDPQELISALAEQESGGEPGRLLRRHPELYHRGFTTALLDRAVTLLRADLVQAGRLVRAARWLAEEIDDESCRARAERVSANIFACHRDFRSAVRAYEAALEAFQRIGDEREAAITQNSALGGLSNLGRFDQAFEWAESARETFRKLGDRLRLARLELNLGAVLSRQDRFQEALANYRSAYRELLEVGSPQDIGTCLRNIAVSLQDANEFSAALETYERARDYCACNDLPLLVAEVDYNIAYLYYLRGEYGRAIRRFERNRRRCAELDDPLHMALCDLDQAEIYLELNLAAEAARLAVRGREGFERLGMRYEAAKCSTNLAIANLRRGQDGDALSLLGEAREIFVEEGNTVWPAMIDFCRSRVLQGEGRLAEASRLADDALAAFSGAGLPSRAAMCEIQQARLHLAAAAPELARRRCVSALERLRPLGLPALEQQAWSVLGRALEELGRPGRALGAYREAEANLERLRSHLLTDELKISFLEDKREVYQSLVWLTLEKGLGACPDTVFADVEKAKSRSLADLLAFRATEISARSGSDRAVVERLRRLRQELNPLYRQIDLKLAENDERSRRQVETLRETCRRREEDLLRALREIQAVDAELSSLQQGTTVDLAAIQSKIPRDAVLLEYYFARGTVIACVVAKNSLEIVSLGSARRVRELHGFLRHQLSKLLLGPEYVARFAPTLQRSAESYLRDLHQELVAPLDAYLAGREQLIVVPHDVLHHVPFHALLDGDEYLIDRFSVSYAPSASVFYLCRTKQAPLGSRSLVLGVDDPRAPRIRQEAEAVARILPDALLLLGKEASEDKLRKHGGDARILHLAAHGDFRRDSPMFSAIQLGTSRLSLFDLYDLELRAELVVLSGCGTGLSEVTAAEELVGLVRGLLYAGARSALVTLWDVHDESTTVFMSSFHRHRQGGLRSVEALRRAMRELRESHPHPYFWAPFVLVGECEGA